MINNKHLALYVATHIKQVIIAVLGPIIQAIQMTSIEYAALLILIYKASQMHKKRGLCQI